MRIAWVSSWPPRHCGIATYSNDLVAALRSLGHEVEVVCHTDGGKEGEEDVYPVIDISHPSWDEILCETVKKIDPDILHIQHEYALYSYENDYGSGLLRPLFLWRIERKFPVVITYHSVFRVLNKVERYFMDVSLTLANAGIVHEEYQRIYLPMNIGRMPENVYVIPHGAKEIRPYPNAKEEFNLAGKRIVGMIGWWEPNKGFERVVKLWSEIVKELGPNHVLVVAGDARPGSSSGRIYKPKLLEAIESSPAKDSIKVIMGQFDPDTYNKVVSTFDLIILPYTHGSQSGNLAHAFALGVPAVATSIEGLKAEVEESGAGRTTGLSDDSELKHCIVSLMFDEELRKHYAERAKNYVTNEVRWSIIARKHLRLYDRSLEDMKGEEEKRSLDGKIHL